MVHRGPADLRPVVVAHRLATAARSDRVVVLHGGRIVEEGRPADLLAVDGWFARLWRAGELEPAVDDDMEAEGGGASATEERTPSGSRPSSTVAESDGGQPDRLVSPA